MIPEFDSLVPRSTISELVRLYQQAEHDVRAGYALVKRGLDALNYGTRERNVDFENPDELAFALRRATWRSIVSRLQMERAMSVKAWTEFDQKLQKEDPPPVTVEIIEGMVRQYRIDLPKMLEDSVVEMFEWLRPRDSEYKTNTEYEIGKRVILNRVVRVGFGHWDVEYYYDQYLRALENVFDLCAGKIPQEKVSHYSALSLAIKACDLTGPCQGETEYFRFKGYRKGSLHIEFRRPDLVTRLNAIAGGTRLKPVAAAG